MLLNAEGINKSFYSATGTLICSVLRDLSLSLNPAEKVAIIGPSGSGKSTLLNIIGGLERPDAGQVLFQDTPISSFPAKKQAQYRNMHVGFIYQKHLLLPQHRVFENVLLPCLADKSKTTREEGERAKMLLERLGLSDKMNAYPETLSVGESQRVAFARALVRQPELILADEPTGSLDKAHARRAMELLCEISEREHTALIVVTHSDMAASFMTRQYQLTDGSLYER